MRNKCRQYLCYIASGGINMFGQLLLKFIRIVAWFPTVFDNHQKTTQRRWNWFPLIKWNPRDWICIVVFKYVHSKLKIATCPCEPSGSLCVKPLIKQEIIPHWRVYPGNSFWGSLRTEVNGRVWYIRCALTINS